MWQKHFSLYFILLLFLITNGCSSSGNKCKYDTDCPNVEVCYEGRCVNIYTLDIKDIPKDEDTGNDSKTEDIIIGDINNSDFFEEDNSIIDVEDLKDINNFPDEWLEDDFDDSSYKDVYSQPDYGGDLLADSGCTNLCTIKDKIYCNNGRFQRCIEQDGCLVLGQLEECNNPPDNFCINSMTLGAYDRIGHCNNDDIGCEYTYSEVLCQNGCANGMCQNCIPACQNKQCGNDGCGGLCGVCNFWEECNPQQICVSSLVNIPDSVSGKHYSYAPAAIDLGGGKIGYWSCFNADSGVVRDHIAFFGGAGIYRIVLSPSTNLEFDGSPRCYQNYGQDSVHVCDPSIVSGKFTFGGTTYNYAMFYTGSDCYIGNIPHNQIFVAFSNDIANGGNWVKYTDQYGFPIPVVEYDDYSTPAYGVGQPSATSVSPGVVILFYTRGTAQETATYRRVIDLSDLDKNGIKIVQPDMRITNDGLTAIDGTPAVLNNADFAYDGNLDIFIAVRDRQLSNSSWFPPNNPNYISAAVQVAIIPGLYIWSGGGRWKELYTIDSTVSGWERNHNAGLVRNIAGGVVSPNKIGVVFTISCDDTRANCSTFLDALWTYNLYQIMADY